MKIGIDARFVGPKGTGLGMYAQKLIENLIRIDHKNKYAIFLRKENWQYLKIGQGSNFKKVPADIQWYSIEEQIKLPNIFKNENLDLLHIPHFNAPIFYRGKFVVTIHDLIHHKFRETSATTKNPTIFKLKRLAYQKVINNAVYKSQKIITPSNYVKDDIIKNFRVNPHKVVVTYEAAEEEYTKVSDIKSHSANLLKKYHLQKPYLIYVGNAYPHKNLPNLLKAIQSLNSQDLPEIRLVIVSARDIFTKRVQDEADKLGLKRLVVLTGYLEPKELSQIFKNAQAYVFPSLSEGFGIPGLNAMASGLPVVSADIPTLKEIYQDAALYFNPYDVNQIKAKLRQMIISQKTRDEYIKRGYLQFKKYSWLKMAEQTKKVYESIQIL